MLTLIRCLFHPRVTAWHVKDPGHTAKVQVTGSRKEKKRKKETTHTTLTQRSWSRVTIVLA